MVLGRLCCWMASCTLPDVLVGAGVLGVLAILGGLLDGIHDLAVLLREGDDSGKGDKLDYNKSNTTYI